MTDNSVNKTYELRMITGCIPEPTYKPTDPVTVKLHGGSIEDKRRKVNESFGMNQGMKNVIATSKWWH